MRWVLKAWQRKNMMKMLEEKVMVYKQDSRVRDKDARLIGKQGKEFGISWVLKAWERKNDMKKMYKQKVRKKKRKGEQRIGRLV